MTITPQKEQIVIICQGKELEQVETFKYLGAIITENGDCSSVVTVSKCFLSVGFGRFCRKNLGFQFGLGFRDKRIVNFFMTRVIWHDFHHC